MSTIERILNLLAEKQNEQRVFADAIGIEPQTITDWKAGRSKSYNKYLDKIAEFFSVSVDYLLGKDEIKNRPTSSDDMELIYREMEEHPELKEYVTLHREHSNMGVFSRIETILVGTLW